MDEISETICCGIKKHASISVQKKIIYSSGQTVREYNDKPNIFVCNTYYVYLINNIYKDATKRPFQACWASSEKLKMGAESAVNASCFEAAEESQRQT